MNPILDNYDEEDDLDFCIICNKNEAKMKKVQDLMSEEKYWFKAYVCSVCAKKIGSGKIKVKNVVLNQGMTVEEYLDFEEKIPNDKEHEFEELRKNFQKNYKTKDYEKMVKIVFDVLFEGYEATDEEIKEVVRIHFEEEDKELPSHPIRDILVALRNQRK